jgi:hypothetical protein
MRQTTQWLFCYYKREDRTIDKMMAIAKIAKRICFMRKERCSFRDGFLFLGIGSSFRLYTYILA